MKVNFSRAALADALGLLTSVVPTRTPKPILQCVHITVGEKDVRLDTTDLEAGITYFISEVKVERTGEALVQADRLAAIVHESCEEVLTLEVSDTTCEITGTDSHFTIYTQEPSQYPLVPSFEGPADIEVSLDNLLTGIGQCIFATAKESSRYAINGVLWEIKGKKLLLVATDGRRLARSKVDLALTPANHIAEKKVIVPAKTMAILAKISSHGQGSIAGKLTGNQIVFSYANVVISSRLIEGNFPKYEDIIPHDCNRKLLLSTNEVLSAVRRAALLTSQESRGIKLSIGQDKLVFSSRTPETGTAQVTMAIDYKGEPIDIGFNPQFLIDVFRVMPTAEFEMQLSEPDRPGLIKSGADFLYVLMPINLA